MLILQSIIVTNIIFKKKPYGKRRKSVTELAFCSIILKKED